MRTVWHRLCLAEKSELVNYSTTSPCFPLMVKGGIPGIENIGGDLDKVTGKRCFFMALPWRWPGGDGCIVRVLAIVDPEQKFRFETGK